MTQQTRLSRFAVPLWAQLAGIFLLILAVPTTTGAFLFLETTQSIDRESVGAYIQQNGLRQRQALTNTFRRAGEDIFTFANDRETNQLLVGLLLADVTSNLAIPASSTTDFDEVARGTILNPVTTLFRDVRLLDSRGVLVAAAGNLPAGTFIVGADESSSSAYQALVSQIQDNAATRQAVVVTERNNGTVEFINAVRLRNSENIIGYVVATLDVENIILPTLLFNDDVYPAYSFLLSNNGVVLTTDNAVSDAENSRDSLGVERALQNQTGFSFYPIAGEGSEEVAGYYARLQDTPFVMVTQVRTADVIRQRQDYLSAVLFPLLIGLVTLTGVLALFSRYLTEPLEGLQRAMGALSVGSFDVPVPAVTRGDEIGDVARAFDDMRGQVQNLIEDLERRIDRRTRDMETTQEISRYAATQRNLQALMDDVVNLIVERFDNIYHTQIFLVDADNRFAVLRASTGTVGDELLSRGHRLAVGSVSVIGQVTAQNEFIIARNTAVSEVHRRNEFLPETRAELAIPLRLGGRVIGALDVQSRASATFDTEQIAVLTSMADQLAIAIENTRLYQESVQRLRSLEEKGREETNRAWQEYLYDNRMMRIVRQAGTPTDANLDELRARAIASKRPVIGDETERQTFPIAVPLRLRGEIIGAIACEIPIKTYDSNKLQLAEDLSERLALSLDNTRLYEQSRRATERERLVNEISSKLTTQTDVNRILQTAVREVGQALRSPQVSIRLNRRDAQDGRNDGPSDNRSE